MPRAKQADPQRVIDAIAAEKRRAEFYAAFGEFVLAFANTEKEILEVLFAMAKVTTAVATSIFSGVHIDTAKDFIKRIIDAEAARGATTDYTLLVTALDHLGHITRVRNDVLHHGLEFWIDDDPLMHNRLRANTPAKIKEYRISVKDLHNMILDLRKISNHILLQFPPQGARFFPHVENSARAPWRYKPREQSGPPRKTQRSRPKRPIQR